MAKTTDIQRLFSTNSPSETAVNHDVWARILAKRVRQDSSGLNRVDYGSIKHQDRESLGEYIGQLCNFDVLNLDRREQFAFWINLYNAVTVKAVVDHYPVSSIRDIKLGGSLSSSVFGGPWKAKLVNVCGSALSLDEIENTILRGIFKDARLHYAINCGSIGCPNLRGTPFTSTTLDRDLDEAAREFINSPRGVAIENGRLILSGIFKWYRRDFGGSEQSVLAHIRGYSEPSLRSAIDANGKVDRYDYNWRLNDWSGCDRII